MLEKDRLTWVFFFLLTVKILTPKQYPVVAPTLPPQVNVVAQLERCTDLLLFNCFSFIRQITHLLGSLSSAATRPMISRKITSTRSIFSYEFFWKVSEIINNHNFIDLTLHSTWFFLKFFLSSFLNS